MEPVCVTNFREYLKVKSDHPEPDYYGCCQLLKSLYGDLDLIVRQVEPVKGKPVLLFTRPGTDPSLPSILLNSHTDVVPVDQSKWKHGPFSGEKDGGKIYGRGSQDTKCLGIQAMEALKSLAGVQLLRTVHVSFVPDEEIGGKDGMLAWIQTDSFKKLNVGCAFDEGALCPLPAHLIFTTERTPWTVEVTVRGQSGDGTTFHGNTASEKLFKLLNRVQELRSGEEAKYLANQKGDWPRDTTNVNLTMIHGGSSHDELPDEIKVTFLCRLATTLDFDQFERCFRDICKECGDGVSVDFVNKDPKWPESSTSMDYPFWSTFKKAADKMGAKLIPITCPGTTDGHYLRQIGITCYGFTPMCATPTLLHDHDEFVFEDQFVRGVDIFKQLIMDVASIPKF